MDASSERFRHIPEEPPRLEVVGAQKESPYTTRRLMAELTHDYVTGRKLLYEKSSVLRDFIGRLNPESKKRFYGYAVAHNEHLRTNPANAKESDERRRAAHIKAAKALVEQWPSLFKGDTEEIRVEQARHYIDRWIGDAVSEEVVWSKN